MVTSWKSAWEELENEIKKRSEELSKGKNKERETLEKIDLLMAKIKEKHTSGNENTGTSKSRPTSKRIRRKKSKLEKATDKIMDFFGLE